MCHNCLKTQKVNTFPRFLMEYPVFFMCIHGVYEKIQKEKNLKFFLDLLGFEPWPQNQGSVGQNSAKTLQFLVL